MATLVKVQAQWTGFQGAPGYTNWYGLSDGDAQAAADALGPRMRTFFNALVALIPDDASIKVQRTYQVVNSINGNITSEAQLTADPTIVVGTSNAGWAGPAGAGVTWDTGAFNSKGHRIRARTYLVPLTGSAFDTNGVVISTAVTTIQNAANAALGGTGSLGAFTRPSAPGANDGQFNIAIAALVRNHVYVLRTRAR